MKLQRDALLLRIFLGEDDELEGEFVFRKVVLKAREMNLAGATVLRGPLGDQAFSMLAPYSAFPRICRSSSRLLIRRRRFRIFLRKWKAFSVPD